MTITSTIEIISDKVRLHFIDLGDYDQNILQAIQNNISKICNGIAGDDDISVLKIEIRNWFAGKDEGKICGFIAEFFCHLYLNQLDFEQHFLFRNLEETRSMKKGFDGLYQFNGEIFLYESKSTLPTTSSVHNSNIGEAYRDLRDKLNGSKLDSQGNPLDPWSNAVNHASLQQILPNKTLIQNLNDFKKNFIKGNFENIKNFNIIPSSTIYMEAAWQCIDVPDLKTKLANLINRYAYNKIEVICINKRSVTGFITYLNS
jgi:hypothetical protein